MAVLNNIRKHGIFLILIIALALFAFILSSVIRNGGFSSGKSRNTIAVINGQELSRFDFDNRLQVARKNSPTTQSQLQTVDRVWNTLLRRTVVEQEIQKLGLEVGSPQINSVLAQNFGFNQNFTTNGQFDVNKLRAYVSQIKAVNPQAYQNWLRTEQQIVEQAKTQLYFSLAQAGMGATKLEAKQAYKLNNTSFDLKYVKIPYTAVDDSKVSVSNSDIQQYINSHKKEFTTKGSRNIRYVLFEDKASSEDVSAIKKELNELLNDHKSYNKAAGISVNVDGFRNTKDYVNYLAEYSDIPFTDTYSFKSDLPEANAEELFNTPEGDIYGPYKANGYWNYSKVVDTKQMADSVKVKQILISYKGLPTGAGLERTKAEAEQLADSLLAVVQANPDKFSDIAQNYSSDTRSKEKGGEIGWVAHRKDVVNPLYDFVFNNNTGDIEVIENQAGYHIVAIQDTKNKQKVVKLATLAAKITPSNKTENLLFNETTKFQIAAKQGDFAKAAKKSSYAVKTVKELAPLSEYITGVGSHRNIVQWAFEKTTKPGDLKRFTVEQGYLVVQMTASTSAGLQSPEEAAAKVKPILLKKKKGDYLNTAIKGNNLNQIAATYNTQVRSKNGVYLTNPNLGAQVPKVIGHAFSMKKGEMSGPISTDSGVYVIQLVSKDVPQDLKSYHGIAYQVTKENLQNATLEMVNALKDKATVKDNRADFY